MIGGKTTAALQEALYGVLKENKVVGFATPKGTAYILPQKRYQELCQEERERAIKDLYFLDEVIADIEENGGRFGAIDTGVYFFGVALRDWYRELYEKVGHSRQERDEYLRKNFGDEWVDDGHFLSEEQLDELLA